MAGAELQCHQSYDIYGETPASRLNILARCDICAPKCAVRFCEWTESSRLHQVLIH